MNWFLSCFISAFSMDSNRILFFQEPFPAPLQPSHCSTFCLVFCVSPWATMLSFLILPVAMIFFLIIYPSLSGKVRAAARVIFGPL